MKNLIFILGLVVMLATSCSSYVCPTYSQMEKTPEGSATTEQSEKV